MTSIKLAVVGIVYFILLSVTGCTEEGGETSPILAPPVLENSYPVNGASGIDTGNIIIQLTFDQNVFCPSAGHHLITIGDASVNNVTANLKVVTIEASGLDTSTTYELVIPANIIHGPTKVGAAEIRINFTTFSPKPIDQNYDEQLVTESPSQQAVNLYNYLLENYGKNILSSTIANVSWNTNEAEWVKLHAGKYPAINTVDYVHLSASPANWIDYSNISFLEEWWNHNGIVSAGWHWRVPISEGATEMSFYSENNSFSAANGTVSGTWENNVINADLEKIANYLLLLQNKGIPVIWRPLHEAAGNIYNYEGGVAWFWWGYDGAEAYKKLWIYMFDYFKNKNLDNLIWVWTTQTKDHAFYPGDEYVDIIGRDIYGNGNAEDIADQFNTIQETYPNKMVTLSELGNAATISSQWSEGAKWSFFMPWYDYDRTSDINSDAFKRTDHSYANADWWIDAYNQSYVISRDELPDLK